VGLGCREGGLLGKSGVQTAEGPAVQGRAASAHGRGERSRPTQRHRAPAPLPGWTSAPTRRARRWRCRRTLRRPTTRPTPAVRGGAGGGGGAAGSAARRFQSPHPSLAPPPNARTHAPPPGMVAGAHVGGSYEQQAMLQAERGAIVPHELPGQVPGRPGSRALRGRTQACTALRSFFPSLPSSSLSHTHTHPLNPSLLLLRRLMKTYAGPRGRLRGRLCLRVVRGPLPRVDAHRRRGGARCRGDGRPRARRGRPPPPQLRCRRVAGGRRRRRRRRRRRVDAADDQERRVRAGAAGGRGDWRGAQPRAWRSGSLGAGDV
jgi:hypothetical protein